jgi:hypothetical protein
LILALCGALASSGNWVSGPAPAGKSDSCLACMCLCIGKALELVADFIHFLFAIYSQLLRAVASLTPVLAAPWLAGGEMGLLRFQ